MKTIREILEKITWHSVRNEDGTITLMVEGITPDQALKEIEELLLKSLPGKYIYKKVDGKLYQQGWNEALEDTRKAIKLIFKEK